MRDATFNEGDQGSWVNLPVKMQEFVDKHFAKYQLCIKQAELKLEKGKLDQTEVDAVKQKCIRPFVLMLGTGQPASPAYIKSHLLNMEDGSLKLKEGSQAIMVLFDLFKLEVKIGGLEWVALRVLKAEVQFDGITLQPDNTFLKGLQSAPAAGVPNLEMYDSQGEEEEDAANQETGKDAMTTEQEFEMMGLVPFETSKDPEAVVEAGDTLQQIFEEHVGVWMQENPESEDEQTHQHAEQQDFYDRAAVEKYLEEMLVQPTSDESCYLRIWMDDSGELVTCSDQLEIVADGGKERTHQPQRTLQYMNSEAYKYLRGMGLSHTPPVQGCGLSYNRFLGQIYEIDCSQAFFE